MSKLWNLATNFIQAVGVALSELTLALPLHCCHKQYLPFLYIRKTHSATSKSPGVYTMDITSAVI